jgi:7-cyano-7-deazaguanine synthase
MLKSWPAERVDRPLAVLCSGGLDSAVLLAEALPYYSAVVPIYVRVGTVWEEAEEAFLRRFLAAIATPRLQELMVLQQPVADVYPAHWSMTGDGTPAAGTPDEDSFLPGRNLLLFAKPLLYCLHHRIPELATAPLAGNPFPDATAEFYDGLAALASRAVEGRVRIIRPYQELDLHKTDVLNRGLKLNLPLKYTFSCARPIRGGHCGACAKCHERASAFRDAHTADPTDYAQPVANLHIRPHVRGA